MAFGQDRLKYILKNENGKKILLQEIILAIIFIALVRRCGAVGRVTGSMPGRVWIFNKKFYAWTGMVEQNLNRCFCSKY